MTTFSRHIGKLMFRAGIPLVFFTVVFSIIHPSDVAELFSRADWKWFGLGCACVVLANYLCSIRTRGLLFDTSQPLLVLWHIHALRALITGALPFSTGELSYAYYLKKYCVTPFSKGIAVLVSVRFLEFSLFVFLQFLLAAIGIFLDASPQNTAILVILGIILGLVCLVVWKTDSVVEVLTLVRDRVFGDRILVKGLSARIDQFSMAVGQVFRSDYRHKLICLTFCIVVLRNVFIIATLGAMGVHISIWFVVFLFAFLFVTQFVQGFGSFGNQEAGMSGALMVVGYTPDEALAIAVGAHLLQWIPVLVLGAISYVGIHHSK